MRETISRYFEWVLPSGTFKGPSAEQDLQYARCLLVVVYLGYSGVFLSTLLALLHSGKVEVLETGFKVDKVEAPSVAICPFNANTTILRPESGPVVEVYKYDLDGEKNLTANSVACTYDRTCVCVDLSSTQLRDHRRWESEFTGTTGVTSEARMKFRERVELRTQLRDTSVDATLKVGFYDSKDPAPSWFYMHNGGYVLGQLELHVWRVSDFTWDALQAARRGELDALYAPRHMWRYTSQEILPADGQDLAMRGREESRPLLLRMRTSLAAERSREPSRISYEMKHFFVSETISGESAFSAYTVYTLVILLLVRGTVIELCRDALFPVWVDPGDGPKQRELSGGARFLQGCCCRRSAEPAV